MLSEGLAALETNIQLADSKEEEEVKKFSAQVSGAVTSSPPQTVCDILSLSHCLWYPLLHALSVMSFPSRSVFLCTPCILPVFPVTLVSDLCSLHSLSIVDSMMTVTSTTNDDCNLNDLLSPPGERGVSQSAQEDRRVQGTAGHRVPCRSRHTGWEGTNVHLTAGLHYTAVVPAIWLHFQRLYRWISFEILLFSSPFSIIFLIFSAGRWR